MNAAERTALSKNLSYILRHKPDAVGITLDDAGWTGTDALIDALARSGKAVTREQLEEVVATSPKKRFELSGDGSRIRARQGHSVSVELGYEPATPPQYLFHGTPRTSLDSILSTGLNRAKRHHVHMSTNKAIMLEAARRRGEPVLLRIDAAAMHEAGHAFFLTGNDVWLTEAVPPRFIEVVDAE